MLAAAFSHVHTALAAVVELTDDCSNVLAMACGLSARLSIMVDELYVWHLPFPKSP